MDARGHDVNQPPLTRVRVRSRCHVCQGALVMVLDTVETHGHFDSNPAVFL